LAVNKLSPKEQILTRRAKDILIRRRGKENAISARDMSKSLGIKDGDTFINTRTIIDKTIRRYQLPIAAHTSTPAGYYLIKSPDELYEYMGTLESRKLQIEDKKALVFRNYIDYYGGLDVQEEA
jgi:hypothetical protein